MIEDRGQTDRVTILATITVTLTLALTYDLDFHFPASYGHKPYTSNNEGQWLGSLGSRDRAETDGHDRLQYRAR